MVYYLKYINKVHETNTTRFVYKYHHTICLYMKKPLIVQQDLLSRFEPWETENSEREREILDFSVPSAK